jgi:hypothetical protein
MMRLIRASALLLALVITGCGTNPPAVEVPATFDLSGNWQLVPSQSDVPPTLLQLRARGGFLHLVTSDFCTLEARALRIEQDARSMGIACDAGTWRDVSWGERRRGLWVVQAGWLQDALVILSKAEDANASETFRLDGNRVLTILIELEAGGERIAITRTYTRTE